MTDNPAKTERKESIHDEKTCIEKEENPARTTSAHKASLDLDRLRGHFPHKAGFFDLVLSAKASEAEYKKLLKRETKEKRYEIL